jgi:hypothetical protein
MVNSRHLDQMGDRLRTDFLTFERVSAAALPAQAGGHEPRDDGSNTQRSLQEAAMGKRRTGRR